MKGSHRAWLVAVAAIITLGYTLYGTAAQGSELDIQINFWGLVALVLILVFGIRWARRGDRRDAP